MKAKSKREAVESQTSSIRVSVTFPRDQYKLLEQIAHEKKVSAAWVVREAVEQYLSQKWPLFGNNK